jgi:hypothetical protein
MNGVGYLRRDVDGSLSGAVRAFVTLTVTSHFDAVRLVKAVYGEESLHIRSQQVSFFIQEGPVPLILALDGGHDGTISLEEVISDRRYALATLPYKPSHPFATIWLTGK